MTIPIDGSTVPLDFFFARSLSGAFVAYAYHECVAVVTANGQCYKRLKKNAGDVGRRVDAKLAELAETHRWNGALTVTELSEREWLQVEKTLAENVPPELLTGRVQ